MKRTMIFVLCLSLMGGMIFAGGGSQSSAGASGGPVEFTATFTIADDTLLAEAARATELIKYGIIVVASFPMLCLYPFIQKHFVSGVMIGAVKG